MTRERQRAAARAASAVAAAIVAACAVVMTAEYVTARMSLAGDAERIAALQKQTETDASFAPTLAAEQDRITRTRQARKVRSRAISVMLIAASSTFVASAKWLVALDGARPAITLIPLASLKARPATTPAGVAGKPVAVASAAPSAVPAPSIVPAAPAVVAAAPAAPEIDLTFVARTVEKEGRSKEAAIPILQAIQSHYRYLPDEALRRVCELTDVTPAQIAGISSFYARFRRSPTGEHVVRICYGTACYVSGAQQITEELRRQLHIPDGADTDPERMFTLDEVACLGCCSLAPVLMVDDHTAGRLTPAGAPAALDIVRQTKTA